MTLMVGPAVHPQLADVLIHFCTHKIALVADVRCTEPSSCPLLIVICTTVWRLDPGDTLKDYWMTGVIFGFTSSSFIANMCVKHNATDFAQKYPLAAKVVDKSFYVDDCLRCAQLSKLLKHIDSCKSCSPRPNLLRKWNSSSPAVLESIPAELRDSQTSLSLKRMIPT